MRRDLRTAFLSMIIFTVLLGLGYPLLMTGLAQGIFPGKANGSLIKRDGVVVGSALIGQQFYEPVIGKNGKQVVVKGVPQTQPDPRYFQTRPSSTGDNAASSGFSNLGPNNETTLVAFQGYIATYLALNRAPDGSLYDYPALRDAVGELAGLKAADLCRSIVDKVCQFTGQQEFADDVCLVAMEIGHLASQAR